MYHCLAWTSAESSIDNETRTWFDPVESPSTVTFDPEDDFAIQHLVLSEISLSPGNERIQRSSAIIHHDEYINCKNTN